MANKKHALFILLLLSLNGCIDFRGAQNPYKLAPPTAHTVWKPCAKPCPIFDPLDSEFNFLEEVDPLSLAEALDIALLNNPNTKLSWAQARISAAEYGQSLQNDFILSELEGQYQRLRFVIFLRDQRETIFQSIWGGALDLNYLLLDFGQTRYSSYAALESLFNADWSHNQEIQTVIQTVMNDYYNYLYQKEKLVAAYADVDNAQMTLDATVASFKVGLSDVSDEVQAITTLKQNQLAVVQQKQNLHNAYTKLINDLGVPPNLKLKFLGYPEKIETFDVDSLDKLILTTMQNRPELLAAEAKVRSGENALIAAERLNYPTVSTDFNIGRNYYSQGFNDKYNFTFTASLNYPLFQGFFINNSIKYANAELELARASYDQTKLSVLQEVTNYREDVVLAREALIYAKEFLVAAEEEFKVLLAKYRVGTTTIVDVINAQTSVADARSRYAETEKNWFTSLVNLAFATGSLGQQNSEIQELFQQKETMCHEEDDYLVNATSLPRMREESAQTKPPPPVTITPVVQKDVPIYIQAPGHIEAFNTVELKSQVTGVVTGVYYEEGSVVSENQLLVTIDNRPYQASLKQAEAQVSRNRASLKYSEDTTRRNTPLVQEDYVSQNNYENLLRNVLVDDANVQESSAQVDIAKINLEYCFINAPYAGIVGDRLVDVGNLVLEDGSTTLVVLNQIQPIYCSFAVSERFFPRIQKTMKEGSMQVVVSYDKSFKETYTGELTFIDNAVDQTTGMIKLKGTFANSSKELWPGIFVYTRLILEVQKGALLVPQGCVTNAQKGPYLYVMSGKDTVEKRNVTTGQIEGDFIIIEKGLKPGEMVVLEGQQNLTDGKQVSVKGEKKFSDESI